MKATVAYVSETNKEKNTETWTYRHCMSVQQARAVAKKWSLEHPKDPINIGKGHVVGKEDFFCELNPFEIWENGKGMRCLSSCVWSPGKAMKMLPANR